jgi:thioesterase domain-containing protein
VHPVGGNIFCYEALSRQLPASFYGLQSAGLNADEQPLRSIEEMARTYLDAIRALIPSEPLHLGGWSMGGMVAYEMARQVVAAGGEVASLILLDTAAPGSYGDRSIPKNILLANTLVKDLSGVFGITLKLNESTLHSMEEDEQLDHILMQASAADAIPDYLGTNGMKRLLEVFANNLEALYNYEGTNYTGSLTIISARDRPESKTDQDLGWRTLVSGDLDVHSLAGDHYVFTHPEKVRVVADIIDRVMQATQP